MINTCSDKDTLVAAISALVHQAADKQKLLRNRRRNTRYPCLSRLAVGCLTTDGRFTTVCEGHALDLCSQGIGFLVPMELSLGRKLYVKLGSATSASRRLPVTIKYCARLFEGAYRVGAAFDLD